MQNMAPIKPPKTQGTPCHGGNWRHKYVNRIIRNGKTYWANAGLKTSPTDICKKCGITRKQAEATQ